MTERTSPPDFERLLEHLKHTRAFDFTAYKRSTLSRRIAKRLETIGVGSYTEYIDYLEVHPEEFAQLFNTILINVTTFFRDPDTFEYLRTEIVPSIVRSKAEDEQIRIWSAGCASGEECYSIAILFAEAVGAERFRERVKIYATDIDEEELAIARHASYSERDLEDLPEAYRTKYFEHAGGRWVFNKDYRRSVIFGRHDLLDDAPISRVDLVVCRNTLMYFTQEGQSRIFPRFHFALRDGGYLLLGRAEMLLNFTGAFQAVDLKQRIFRKVRGDDGTRVLADYGGRGERFAANPVSGRLREVAFDQDPVAQIVVDAHGLIALANVRARELFGMSSSDIGRPLQDLEVSYGPVELRSRIADAHQRRQVVQVRETAWPGPTGEPRYFTVQVMPLLDSNDASLGTKILFIDVTRQHDLQEELQHSRQDLETAYEELQSTNEELETTNEELQSTIEELETTNEELQSTNEELETMNQELQSTNEEMEAVNQELRARGFDLARTNIFFKGVLRNVPLAVVVLDEEMQVEFWNDVAADIWGLRQEEVQGRHFLGLDIGLPVEQLRQPLIAVRSAGDQPIETIVHANNRRGRPITVRVLCAHTGGSTDGGRGVIVVMQDVEGGIPRQQHTH